MSISKNEYDLSPLFQYQSPYELYSQVNNFSKKDEFIFDTRLRKAQEAWVMARFCIGYEDLMNLSICVKMSTDEPADATIRLRNGDIVDFQIVESLTLGRKRDEEYKKWVKQGKPLNTRDYRPIKLDPAIEMIKNVIKKKVGKRYSVNRKTNLLVYIDFDKDNLMLDKLYETMGNIDIAPFNEIWLYSSCFVDGRAGHAIARLLPEQLGFIQYLSNEEELT